MRRMGWLAVLGLVVAAAGLILAAYRVTGLRREIASLERRIGQLERTLAALPPRPGPGAGPEDARPAPAEAKGTKPPAPPPVAPSRDLKDSVRQAMREIEQEQEAESVMTAWDWKSFAGVVQPDPGQEAALEPIFREHAVQLKAFREQFRGRETDGLGEMEKKSAELERAFYDQAKPFLNPFQAAAAKTYFSESGAGTPFRPEEVEILSRWSWRDLPEDLSGAAFLKTAIERRLRDLNDLSDQTRDAGAQVAQLRRRERERRVELLREAEPRLTPQQMATLKERFVVQEDGH